MAVAEHSPQVNQCSVDAYSSRMSATAAGQGRRSKHRASSTRD